MNHDFRGAEFGYQTTLARDQECRAIVDRMCAGELLPQVPWADSIFQKIVISRLAKVRDYKVAAEKLAVIKEVFGGAK